MLLSALCKEVFVQGSFMLEWGMESPNIVPVHHTTEQASAGVGHPGSSALASSHGCGVPVAQVLDFAQVDSWRAQRTGFPEVVLGAGKSAEQIAAIMGQLAQNEQIVMATRVTAQVTAWCPADVLLHSLSKVPRLGS